MKGLRLTEEELAAIVKRNHPRKVRGAFAADPVGQPRKAPEPHPTAHVRVRPPEARSDPQHYSRLLSHQLRLLSLPAPVAEYPFAKHEGRKWRLDLAYPSNDPPLAIEVDGAVHRIKGRFDRDMEKHQALVRLGWKLLRVSNKQVRNGQAVELVRALLAGPSPTQQA